MKIKRVLIRAACAVVILLPLTGCLLTRANTGRRIYSHHDATKAYTHNYGATYSSYKGKTRHTKHRGIECFHGSCKS